jgi:hypothetical protein
MSGPLHFISPLGPFEKWGIDLMGPLLVIRGGCINSLWLP